MPRGDGTGPQGQGPMTGRRMGQCPQGRRSLWPGSRSSDTLPDAPGGSGGRGNPAGTGRKSTVRGLGRGRTDR